MKAARINAGLATIYGMTLVTIGVLTVASIYGLFLPFADGAGAPVLTVLAVENDPIDPKQTSLFWYLLTGFASLITATLGWLVAKLQKQDTDASSLVLRNESDAKSLLLTQNIDTKALLDKLLNKYDERETSSKEREKEADGRLTHAWNEHEKVRIALMHRSDEIAESLAKIVIALNVK